MSCLNRFAISLGLFVLPLTAIVSFFASSPAVADAIPKTDVVLFGGWKSTDAQMQNWRAGAQGNPKFQQDFDFDAVATTSPRRDQASVVRDSQSVIRKWVEKIDSSPPGSVFVLAGHSSGSAVSNEIACRVKSKSKVRLVVLDGFTPQGCSSAVQTECWSAVSGSNPAQKSLNTNTMRGCRSYNEIKPRGCMTAMCLHFSLVNANAVHQGITTYNIGSAGYKNVAPNLSWLEPYSISSLPPEKAVKTRSIPGAQ